jgi:hypothetical protein
MVQRVTLHFLPPSPRCTLLVPPLERVARSRKSAADSSASRGRFVRRRVVVSLWSQGKRNFGASLSLVDHALTRPQFMMSKSFAENYLCPTRLCLMASAFSAQSAFGNLLFKLRRSAGAFQLPSISIDWLHPASTCVPLYVFVLILAIAQAMLTTTISTPLPP